MISSASLSVAVIALGVAVLAYGIASLLQAMAARRDPDRGAGLLLSPLVLGGLGFDVLGFLAGAVALHDLPLFFVQGATSASILVTALLVSVVLHERPDRREALALPLVLAGLAALAVAAEPGPAAALPALLPVGLVLCAPLFGLGGWWCARNPSRISGVGLAALAGLSYGCAGLAARGASALGGGAVDTGIILAVVIVHALQGVVLVTVAMRRAPVNTVTSVLFATEAVGPSAFGLLVLGDRTADGAAWAAVAGFGLLIAATALLTRDEGAVLAGDSAHAGRDWPRVDLRPTAAVNASPDVGRHRADRPVRQAFSSSEKSNTSSSSVAAASKMARPVRSLSRSS